MIPEKETDLKNFLLKNRISSFKISAINEEGSNRIYYRIKSTKKNKTYVLCITYPFVEQDDFIQLSKYLLQKKAKIPKLLGYSHQEGLILLEDGGNLYLQDQILFYKQEKKYKSIIELYKKIIDELLYWHSLKDIPIFVEKRYFDKTKLNFEIDFFFERLNHQRIEIKNLKIRTFFTELNEFLSDSKHEFVFTHRDFHSRNILLKKNQFKIIDYQDARMGLRWYDLSSLLFDPYVQLDFSIIKILFEYYLQKISLKEIDHREIFYLQALQRLTKALGSFLFLGYEKQKPKFISYILPTLELLLDLYAIVRFPDFIFQFYQKLYEYFKREIPFF